MTSRFFKKMAPVIIGMVSTWTYVGCGGQDVAEIAQDVTTTKAAQLNQTDVNTFTNDIKLANCTFVIGSGTGTFTPSNELAQALYGDPHGTAHKTTFPVPPISASGATIAITSLKTEMASTGLTLAGANATVKLSFDGMLHASIPVPVIGTVTTDVQINSSSLSVALVYNSMTELASASSVTSNFNVQAKNCGAFGWCNSIVTNYLKSNLPGLVEAPLKAAITKGLGTASATTGLDDILVAAYNLKDPQATKWSMVAHSLTLAAGAFNFTAQRD